MSSCVDYDNGTCRATRPLIITLDSGEIPGEVRNEIELKHPNSSYKQCSYCKTIWYEYLTDNSCLCKMKIAFTNIGSEDLIWIDR